MKQWNKNWQKSKNPKKQRKYIAKAPLHVKSQLLQSHLSKELRKKYKTRSTRIRIGDKVKIMLGNFKGKIGAIEKINIKKSKAYVRGAEMIKKDGSKAMYPIHTSNLLIQDLVLDDKKRIIEVKTNNVKLNKDSTNLKNNSEVKK